jgi:probable phosphoglycerate mutase
VAKGRGLRVAIDRGLLECDFGEWTGRGAEGAVEAARVDDRAALPERLPLPGGESFAEMQTRMTGSLAALVERHAGGVVVAVSHADPIKAAVASALGTHLDLFQRIVISPCSVTAISYGASGPTVLTVNSVTGQLSELAPS